MENLLSHKTACPEYLLHPVLPDTAIGAEEPAEAVEEEAAEAELEPEDPISGAAAYDLYVEHTLPHLLESGGKLELVGEGGAFLIGPPEERWDAVLLVRHRSIETFMSFAQNEAYLDGMGHRLAAVSDSRLLPVVPRG